MIEPILVKIQKVGGFMGVKIVETSVRDGHQSLFATRMTTDEVLTGEVYYDLVATNGQMQKVQDMISAGANAILGEYNAQNESEKQALLFNIRATWNQNIQKAPKKSFLDKLLGR